MASAPSDPKPVLGRVDRDGRLVAADPELERLQVEAGSAVGATLALPQLAAVVRVAQRLQIPVSRRVLAAGQDQDVDMWVRAAPDGDEIALVIDQWSTRPASQPRLASIAAVEHEKLGQAELSWSVDEQLHFVAVAAALAERMGVDSDRASGQALTKLFRLEEDETGEMPLLSALVSKTGFANQRVTARDTGEQLVLTGEAVLGRDGQFAGFEGSAAPADSAPANGLPQPLLDGSIDAALRSPLDNIVRSAEEMIGRSDAPVRDEYRVYAADIAAAARHLLSVIRSLGDRSGAEGRQPIDVAALTLEAVALIESAAMEREIAVAVQPVENFSARGEARGVIQILVNLIGNAVRYSPKRTAVTVSFERNGQSAMVHVADEGPGIDPADQDRIFEPFQQGSGGSEGSGLGLAIARRLARSMGGNVQLQSMPGDGSRFTLVLPAA